MVNTKNPWAVLGLDATADADDVRAAYRQLVKSCHPDKFQDPAERQAAQQRMIELNQAYEEALRLTEPRKQTATYNRELNQTDALTIAGKMLRRGNPASALRQLMRCPDRGGAWYAMQGHVLMALDQYESAHQSYREAVRREPNNIEYRRGALDAAVALKRSRTLIGRLRTLSRRWGRRGS